jgi:hypothetical protein
MATTIIGHTHTNPPHCMCKFARLGVNSFFSRVNLLLLLEMKMSPQFPSSLNLSWHEVLHKEERYQEPFKHSNGGRHCLAANFKISTGLKLVEVVKYSECHATSVVCYGDSKNERTTGSSPSKRFCQISKSIKSAGKSHATHSHFFQNIGTFAWLLCNDVSNDNEAL